MGVAVGVVVGVGDCVVVGVGVVVGAGVAVGVAVGVGTVVTVAFSAVSFPELLLNTIIQITITAATVASIPIRIPDVFFFSGAVVGISRYSSIVAFLCSVLFFNSICLYSGRSVPGLFSFPLRSVSVHTGFFYYSREVAAGKGENRE